MGFLEDDMREVESYDWELEMELQDFYRELEWESEQERHPESVLDFLVTCDSCRDVDHAENMWALGYANLYLCDQCWEEAEEDEY